MPELSNDDYLSSDGSVQIHHLDGVPWHRAPKPRRFHRCRPHTTGILDFFTLVERCRCGAIRRNGHRWINRNSRKGSNA